MEGAMTEHSELLPNLLDEDAFEVQMRGYSRRQVDEFVARTRSQTRDLEERLARALDDSEQVRQQLAVARQQPGAKPAHEEISERIAQILKLADDEAKAQKARANDEIAKARGDAQREVEATINEAREKAERMLTSAQDQAESFVSAARAEADKARDAARTEAEQAAADARKEADELLVSARSKAERMLAESTARSTAINDGAARRLELLSRDSARGSLEDEVAKAVAGAMSGTAESPRVPGQSPPADARMARKTTKPAAQTPAAASVGTTAPAQPVVSPSIAPQPAGPSGPHARPAPGAAPTAPPSPAPQPVRSGGQRQAGPAERQAGPAERPLGLGRDHSARDQAARGTAGDDSAQHQARKVTGPN